MMKILLDKEKTINWNSGLTTFCSWQRLQPYLEMAIDLKPNEKIIGLEMVEDGIIVRLEYIKK